MCAITNPFFCNNAFFIFGPFFPHPYTKALAGKSSVQARRRNPGI
ncbi:hypothetical protein HMPREF1548_01539 [Clostridium sp. KLE 1755]|nr:hypothetical protein HMPREF1548_01539 [Clostridium sp. KLE 1755]